MAEYAPAFSPPKMEVLVSDISPPFLLEEAVKTELLWNEKNTFIENARVQSNFALSMRLQLDQLLRDAEMIVVVNINEFHYANRLAGEHAEFFIRPDATASQARRMMRRAQAARRVLHWLP